MWKHTPRLWNNRYAYALKLSCLKEIDAMAEEVRRRKRRNRTVLKTQTVTREMKRSVSLQQNWDYTPERWMCGPAVRSTSTQTFTHSVRTRCFHLLNDPVIVHSFFQDSQMINRFILMIRRWHRVLENKSTAPWVDIINLFCIGAEHYQSLTSQWSLQKRKEIKWRTTRDKFLASYI